MFVTLSDWAFAAGAVMFYGLERRLALATKTLIAIRAKTVAVPLSSVALGSQRGASKRKVCHRQSCKGAESVFPQQGVPMRTPLW